MDECILRFFKGEGCKCKISCAGWECADGFFHVSHFEPHAIVARKVKAEVDVGNRDFCKWSCRLKCVVQEGSVKFSGRVHDGDNVSCCFDKLEVGEGVLLAGAEIVGRV